MSKKIIALVSVAGVLGLIACSSGGDSTSSSSGGGSTSSSGAVKKDAGTTSGSTTSGSTTSGSTSSGSTGTPPKDGGTTSSTSGAPKDAGGTTTSTSGAQDSGMMGMTCPGPVDQASTDADFATIFGATYKGFAPAAGACTAADLAKIDAYIDLNKPPGAGLTLAGLKGAPSAACGACYVTAMADPKYGVIIGQNVAPRIAVYEAQGVPQKCTKALAKGDSCTSVACGVDPANCTDDAAADACATDVNGQGGACADLIGPDVMANCVAADQTRIEAVDAALMAFTPAIKFELTARAFIACGAAIP
jgi:hypothetical protein